MMTLTNTNQKATKSFAERKSLKILMQFFFDICQWILLAYGKIYRFIEVSNDKDPLKDEYGIAALCWPTHEFYGFIAPEYSENRWPTKSAIILQSSSPKKRKKTCQDQSSPF